MLDTPVGALVGMTVVTPDLDRSIDIYAEYLGYRGHAPKSVGSVLAETWGCPAAAEARMATLRPEGGGRFIRFVEAQGPAVAPFTTYGWSAIEIVVQDLDALAAKLANSPFKIIGAPAVLDFDFTDKIRAMQVQAPSGEVLYLTQIEDEIPGFELPKAESFVGAPFIAVLGSPALKTAAQPYALRGRPAGPTFQARIDVISNAYQMPHETRHSLTTVALANCTLIEIDALPAGAKARPLSSVGLPTGIAMASFNLPGAADGSTFLLGACGEGIELVAGEIQ